MDANDIVPYFGFKTDSQAINLKFLIQIGWIVTLAVVADYSVKSTFQIDEFNGACSKYEVSLDTTCYDYGSKRQYYQDYEILCHIPPYSIKQ